MTRAGGLVAVDRGQRAAPGAVGVGDVGVADGAGRDADRDLAGPGRVERHLLDAERLAEGPADGGAHATILLLCDARANTSETGERNVAKRGKGRILRPEVDAMQLRFTIALVLAVLAAVPVNAQAQQGLTLQQVEAKYPRMRPVHIAKCDHNGDGLYTRTEMLCVSGIYQQMYLAD